MAGLIAEKTPEVSLTGESGTDWSRDAAFELMQATFVAASARTGVIERTFRIGGLRVRASFAGAGLIPAVEPALAHLAMESLEPVDLHVQLWDSATTGVSVPDQPKGGSTAASAITAATHRRETPRVRSSYHAVPRILTLYDAAQRKAVVWFPDAHSVPSNEIASPLRTLLHWWARDNNLQFVHAGAVGLDGRAVLLAGPSGAGKSTSTLAALLAGLDYLGDDYVLVAAGASTTIHSLYSAAKLQPSQIAAFPELRPSLTNADRLATEKALWFVHRDFPERTRDSADAVAVLVPHISGATGSSVVPIARSTALAALAPSTLAQLSGSDQWSLDAMAAFLSRVGAYRLEAGTDLRELAQTIRGVLESENPRP